MWRSWRHGWYEKDPGCIWRTRLIYKYNYILWNKDITLGLLLYFIHFIFVYGIIFLFNFNFYPISRLSVCKYFNLNLLVITLLFYSGYSMLHLWSKRNYSPFSLITTHLHTVFGATRNVKHVTLRLLCGFILNKYSASCQALICVFGTAFHLTFSCNHISIIIGQLWVVCPDGGEVTQIKLNNSVGIN